MSNPIARRKRGLALKNPSLTFGEWVALYSDSGAALDGLINPAEKKLSWDRWPAALACDVRDAVVALHTVGSWRGGGWAIGVVANGVHVLPYVPSALRRIGYHSQADDAQRSIDLFPVAAALGQGDSQQLNDVINAVEKQPDYDAFLAEIEDRVPADWEGFGLPKPIKDFAAMLGDAPIWLDQS